MYEENNQCNVPWAALRPGDIVKIYQEEVAPVDIIPLYCSDQSGITYV